MIPPPPGRRRPAVAPVARCPAAVAARFSCRASRPAASAPARPRPGPRAALRAATASRSAARRNRSRRPPPARTQPAVTQPLVHLLGERLAAKITGSACGAGGSNSTARLGSAGGTQVAKERGSSRRPAGAQPSRGAEPVAASAASRRRIPRCPDASRASRSARSADPRAVDWLPGQETPRPARRDDHSGGVGPGGQLARRTARPRSRSGRQTRCPPRPRRGFLASRISPPKYRAGPRAPRAHSPGRVTSSRGQNSSTTASTCSKTRASRASSLGTAMRAAAVMLSLADPLAAAHSRVTGGRGAGHHPARGHAGRGAVAPSPAATAGQSGHQTTSTPAGDGERWRSPGSHRQPARGPARPARTRPAAVSSPGAIVRGAGSAATTPPSGPGSHSHSLAGRVAAPRRAASACTAGSSAARGPRPSRPIAA